MKFYIYTKAELDFIFDELSLFLRGLDGYVDIKQKCKNRTIGYKKIRFHQYSSGDYTLFMDELENFPITAVDSADYIIVPISIKLPDGVETKEYDFIIDEFLKHLKYFTSAPRKHLFFLVGDNAGSFSSLKNSLVFKASSMLFDKHSIPLYYTTPIAASDKLISDAKYDISFQGCKHLHPTREKVLNYFSETKIENTYLFFTDMYFENFDPANQIKFQSEWQRVLESSKFILCPRGRGISTIRLFESLFYGRIPIVYGDECKLPLEDLIDYNQILIKIPENEIVKSLDYINHFKKSRDLLECSKTARNVWNEYFNPKHFYCFLNRSIKNYENKFNRRFIKFL